MNKQAFKFKKAYFQKFVIGTRKPIYESNMPKKRKRAVCALTQFYELVTMRRHFSRFAVNLRMFKNLRHPNVVE